MTVSYYHDNLWRLFVRWRGSIWKVCWREYAIFITCYYIIHVVYRLLLSDGQQHTFEQAVIWCDTSLTSRIPVTFLLGFYVTSVVARWWSQYLALAWPDDICAFLNVILPGEAARCTRRAAARYLVAACVLGWRDVSTRVRKRFPTLQHLVLAKILTADEASMIRSSPTGHWMLPCDWVQRLGERQLAAGKLPAPIMASFLVSVNNFRKKFRIQYSYAWVSFPLIYTQVATLITYMYFVFCLIARQRIQVKSVEIGEDAHYFYFPIFTTLQFLFYVGWLKVGRENLRPFGEDDDDFELNYIIDRHARAALAIVDINVTLTPDFEDTYAGDPMLLPHTKASARQRDHAPRLGTGEVIADTEDRDMLTYDEESMTISKTTALRKADSHVSSLNHVRHHTYEGQQNLDDADLQSVQSLGI